MQYNIAYIVVSDDTTIVHGVHGVHYQKFEQADVKAKELAKEYNNTIFYVAQIHRSYKLPSLEVIVNVFPL